MGTVFSNFYQGNIEVIKKPPDYGQEATQMFAQQNNFYCDLLSRTNVNKKS